MEKSISENRWQSLSSSEMLSLNPLKCLLLRLNFAFSFASSALSFSLISSLAFSILLRTEAAPTLAMVTFLLKDCMVAGD